MTDHADRRGGTRSESVMTTFDELVARSAEHSEREAGLPGRADPGACGTPVIRYGCTGEQGGEKA